MEQRASLDTTVTVIIATHRRDVLLESAIRSVADQTFRSLEIVLVDDNGEPSWNSRVRGVLERVNADVTVPIRYFRNEACLGSAESRNVGIRHASGEYVTFLDDDDTYLPEKVERQLSHMRLEGSDYSITDLELYSETGKLVERRCRPYLHGADGSALMRLHFMHHLTGTDTLMFRRSYLLEIGGFPRIDVGDEFYLMREAILGGGALSYLPECHVHATIHRGESDALSSGESKIAGENALYAEKCAQFSEFDRSTIAYIRMRHWAVLSFAELRRGRLLLSLVYAVRATLASPLQSVLVISGLGSGSIRSTLRKGTRTECASGGARR